ncbi:MAG: hypothetical protein ACLTXL_12880 [Clostridia bacterium]
MRNDMRPELSEEPLLDRQAPLLRAEAFLPAIPHLEKARLALDGLSRRPADLQVFVSCGQAKGRPNRAVRPVPDILRERMEMVEQAAIEAEPDLYSYLLRGVTEGCPTMR